MTGPAQEGPTTKASREGPAAAAPALSRRDEERLRGTNPRLVRVLRLARQTNDFIVIEGVRSSERQKILFAKGASRTLMSKHLCGRAVDLAAVVNGQVVWEFHHYEKLARGILAAALKLRVDIRWGGHWAKFRDGTHFELYSPP